MSIFVINGFYVYFFLEPLGRMLQGEALETPQNGKMMKVRWGWGCLHGFYHGIPQQKAKREATALTAGQREREMSSMKNPSSLRAECRKIIEKINETFKNHRHNNMFFKWEWFNQSPVEIPTRLPGRNFSQLFHARCRCGNVLLSCLTNLFSLQNHGNGLLNLSSLSGKKESCKYKQIFEIQIAGSHLHPWPWHFQHKYSNARVEVNPV